MPLHVRFSLCRIERNVFRIGNTAILGMCQCLLGNLRIFLDHLAVVPIQEVWLIPGGVLEIILVVKCNILNSLLIAQIILRKRSLKMI